MNKIILITGGQRSGKSAFAEKLALSLFPISPSPPKPLYIATSRIWDDDFKKRVDLHRARRQDQWQLIEEEKYLSKILINNPVILIDCLMLLVTNFFYDNAKTAYNDITQELEQFLNQSGTFIFVTNEIGLGGISPNALQNQLTDLLGIINQFIAKRADEAYLIVSGIPVKIKG